MPSKRTNDSVDRILQDLGQKQNAEGVRDHMTDRQVDEILASVGIDVGGSGSVLEPISTKDIPNLAVGGDKPPVDRFATAVLDDLLGDLPSVRAAAGSKQPAARPAAPVQKQPAAPAPAPVQRQQPVQPPRAAVFPVDEAAEQAAPTPAPPKIPVQKPAAGKTGALGDTTRTGIIKGFLAKMAPEGAGANSDALNLGKEQFVDYFGKSVAVVEDDKGRLRDPSRKKRKGLFGMAKAEDTGEFVPINVSLGGRSEQTAPTPQPAAPKSEEEYYPDEAPAPAPRRARKKQKLLAGLFGGVPADEELAIPEPREEPMEDVPPLQLAGTATIQIPGMPEKTEPPVEEPAAAVQEDENKKVYRSKYSADTHTGMTLGGDTLGFLRDAINSRSKTVQTPPAAEQTSTVYRKKRNTVEFTPGKNRAVPPVTPPRSMGAEPVGEPVMTPTGRIAPESQPATGFTMQMDTAQPDEPAPEDTQGFLAAMGAAQVQSQPTPEPELDTKADTSTFDDIPVSVAQTLTGQVRLADIEARAATLQMEKQRAAAQQHIDEQTTDFEEKIGNTAEGNKLDTASFVNGIAQSINFTSEKTATAQQKSLRGELPDEIPDDDGHYADAVSRLRDEQLQDAADTENELKKPKKPKLGLHLGGQPADEQEAGAEPFEAADTAVKDYETPDDAKAVRHALDGQILQLGLAAVISGILGVAMLYLGTAAVGSVLPLPSMLDPTAGKTPLLAVLLVLLAVSAALSWRTLLEGARGLLRTPSPDSMPLLATLGAAVQLIVFLIKDELYDPARFCLLAGPAALLLCFNNIGRLLAARTAAANFKLVSAGVDHAVAYRLRDAGVLRAVTKGLAEPHPSVLVSRPTQLLKKFMASSAAHGTSDKNQQQFAWIVSACAAFGFLFTLFFRKDAGMAVTALSATLCLGAPLAGTLLSALPARLMQRSAAQVGAVIPGWKDIRQLGRINVIEVTARDMFPAGCVTLGGIKAVNDDHIYTAIVYAASLLADAGDNMREVFLGMIGDANKQLCKVDERQNVYGKGCIGWINGERALIGNRALMNDYNIRLPDMAYEQRHTVNQRRVIYLAVSGKLFAMFQVSYQRDPDTAAVLDTLRHSGMSLIVDCDDFNCDEKLLETAYGLPVGSVKVLSGAEREAMAPATAWLPESEGNMLHLGSFASFVGGLEAAAGAAEGERKSAMVLTASVLLSCALAVIMALAGGLAALPLPALVLYQAAWAVLALIFPLLQRY